MHSVMVKAINIILVVVFGLALLALALPHGSGEETHLARYHLTGFSRLPGLAVGLILIIAPTLTAAWVGLNFRRRGQTKMAFTALGLIVILAISLLAGLLLK